MKGGCLGGCCDIHSRRPYVRLALLLANHGESMRHQIVAPCEGLTVHFVVHEVGVSHALLERCTGRYCVGVQVVANVSVLRSNISRGREDLVDHVDDAIASRDVCQCHRGVADADRSVCHSECGLVAVQHCHCEPVGNCRGLNRSRVHVVGQDVDQCRVLLIGVEGGQIDPSSREGCVSGCEDRERAVCL